MRIQCAGCGKVIRQDDEPGNPTYGCCDECNRTSFRAWLGELGKAMDKDKGQVGADAEPPEAADE